MRGRTTLFLPVLILLSLSDSAGGLGGMLRPQAVIRVTDFGIKSDSRENAVPAVVKALQACRGLENPVLVRSRAFAPFHARKATVTLEACRNVKIDNNIFEGDVLGKNIVLTGTAASEVTVGPGQGWIR